MTETTSTSQDISQGEFVRGLTPETSITEDLITHKIKLEKNGIIFEITAYGTRDKLIGKFLNEQGEQIFPSQLAYGASHDKELYDHLAQLINPAMGIENLEEALRLCNVGSETGLHDHQLLVDWSDIGVRDNEGYTNVNDIICLALRTGSQIRIITMVYDDEQGDGARAAFNDAVEWLIPKKATS